MVGSRYRQRGPRLRALEEPPASSGGAPWGALALNTFPLSTFPLQGGLAGPTTRAFSRDDSAVLENLATPHPPRLLPGQRAVQAGQPDRALGAQLLGLFQL